MGGDEVNGEAVSVSVSVVSLIFGISAPSEVGSSSVSFFRSKPFSLSSSSFFALRMFAKAFGAKGKASPNFFITKIKSR